MVVFVFGILINKFNRKAQLEAIYVENAKLKLEVNRSTKLSSVSEASGRYYRCIGWLCAVLLLFCVVVERVFWEVTVYMRKLL